MLQTYVHHFVRLNHNLELVLGILAQILAGNSRFQKQGKYPLFRTEDNYNLSEILKILDDSLAELRALCEELNLRSALEHIKRFDDERPYRDDRFQSLSNLVREVRQRIEDDLKDAQFLFVTPLKAQYYDEAIFGELLESKFPSAIDDIRGAGNCFAIGQWTATVHHCMGIIQAGLIALAKNLGCTVNIYIDTWEDIIKRVESVIRTRQQNTSREQWKVEEAFYSEIVSDLRAVQKAWRNPTAHFRRQYDEEQSLKALQRVEDFMRHLATRIQER